jgi:hypothetical protein
MNYQELTAEQTLATQKEIDNIEIEVERITRSIEIGKTLEDLKQDERYKKVFDEYYLKDEVIRDTMLLVEKYFLEADQRQSLQDGLIAKSHFNDWVKATTSMEILSVSRLLEHENRLKVLRSLLSVGYPLLAEEVTPPEGVANVK